MKKAQALIDKKALIALLKVPNKIKIIGIEYPSKGDRVKLVIEGDDLPVKKVSKNAKVLPEVRYTVLHHWHNAKIEGVDKWKKEIRVFSLEKINVEERSDGLGPLITGYAAVFNKMSDDLGGFREKIKPGAFKNAIPKSDVRGLFNHDSNYVLGRQSNGTLTIKEDKNGLWMEIEPPDTQIIRDLVLAPIKRGDVREQSFGFIVEKDEWENIDGEQKDKPITRTLLEIRELFDVSPVTFPAYPDTSVALRSMEKAKETTFKPATDNEVLTISTRDFLSAETDEARCEAAGSIARVIFPSLNDEQRSKLIPTSDPNGTTQGDGEDNNSEQESDGTTHQLDLKLRQFNERYEKFQEVNSS